MAPLASTKFVPPSSSVVQLAAAVLRDGHDATEIVDVEGGAPEAAALQLALYGLVVAPEGPPDKG